MGSIRHGVSVLGATAPLVDCVERGRQFARRNVVGDVSDGVSEYDWGEGQVTNLVQTFNAMGRPLDWESRVEGVYAEYQKAKAWEPLGVDKALRWKNATAMKIVGGKAAAMLDALQAAGVSRGTAGTAAGTSQSKLIPMSMANPVYQAPVTTPSSWWDAVPSWAKWAGGAVAVAGVGYLAAPIVIPLIMARKK